MSEGRQFGILLFLVFTFLLGTFITLPELKDETKEWRVKETHSCTIEGVERILYVLDNGEVYFKIGEKAPFIVASNDLDIAFGEDGTVWTLDKECVIRWWNYELIGSEYVLNHTIPRPTEKEPEGWVDDVESLVYDEEGKFVIGYRVTSGESFFVLTQEEMRKVVEWSSDKSAGVPLPRSMSEPDTNPANSPLPD